MSELAESKEPPDPLSGRSGWIVDELAEMSDEELEAYCEYWQWRWDQPAAEGDGFRAWKASNLLSAGLREIEKRKKKRK